MKKMFKLFALAAISTMMYAVPAYAHTSYGDHLVQYLDGQAPKKVDTDRHLFDMDYIRLWDHETNTMWFNEDNLWSGVKYEFVSSNPSVATMPKAPECGWYYADLVAGNPGTTTITAYRVDKGTRTAVDSINVAVEARQTVVNTSMEYYKESQYNDDKDTGIGLHEVCTHSKKNGAIYNYTVDNGAQVKAVENQFGGDEAVAVYMCTSKPGTYTATVTETLNGKTTEVCRKVINVHAPKLADKIVVDITPEGETKAVRVTWNDGTTEKIDHTVDNAPFFVKYDFNHPDGTFENGYNSIYESLPYVSLYDNWKNDYGYTVSTGDRIYGYELFGKEVSNIATAHLHGARAYLGPDGNAIEFDHEVPGSDYRNGSGKWMIDGYHANNEAFITHRLTPPTDIKSPGHKAGTYKYVFNYGNPIDKTVTVQETEIVYREVY